MDSLRLLSDQRIIDCLQTNYGITVTALTFIPLGADMDASVYKAQTDDQSSYFVKLKRGHSHDMGVHLQLLLHDAGIQPIISPIKTNQGQPMCYTDDMTLMVYPFIKGQDGFTRDLTSDQWIILGKALRQIHAFHLPSHFKNQIKQESYSPTWREAVRSIYAHIDAHNTGADQVAVKVAALMKQHRNIIERLVSCAEQRAHTIQKKSPEFMLCHSDLHAGNVLLANDGALYIVDWDQPIMAPKERDLMFIGAGVGNVWNKSDEEALFYSGYGNTKINRDILAYYRCERIVEDIAEYCQELLLTSGSNKDREIMYQHFVGMFEPRGVIDIALETSIDL